MEFAGTGQVSLKGALALKMHIEAEGEHSPGMCIFGGHVHLRC